MNSLRNLEIPGGWSEREVQVGARVFHMLLPARPDAFIEELDEAQLATLPRMRSDPFWSQLWQAAEPLARAVQAAKWPEGTRVLELGCGSGLVGLAALDRGWPVTLSDYVQEAVDLAVENAHRNGFSERAQGLVLDWNSPTSDQYPVIVASDVLYDRRNHEPFLKVIGAMLEPGGTCWIGDAGRSALAEFLDKARAAGYRIELFDANGKSVPDAPLAQFRRVNVGRLSQSS